MPTWCISDASGLDGSSGNLLAPAGRNRLHLDHSRFDAHGPHSVPDDAAGCREPKRRKHRAAPAAGRGSGGAGVVLAAQAEAKDRAAQHSMPTLIDPVTAPGWLPSSSTARATGSGAPPVPCAAPLPAASQRPGRRPSSSGQVANRWGRVAAHRRSHVLRISNSAVAASSKDDHTRAGGMRGEHDL